MDRTAFVVVTAIILMLAFAAGWFSYWVLHRFTNVAGGDLGEMDRLAQSLHEAEERPWTACAMPDAKPKICAVTSPGQNPALELDRRELVAGACPRQVYSPAALQVRPADRREERPPNPAR
jgi:hypothetical protein